MFLYFPHCRCASISMPGRQANLFKHTEEIIKFHMANVDIGMLFISAFMNCGDEVSINQVEVYILCKIQFLASEAERNEIVEQRLGV